MMIELLLVAIIVFCIFINNKWLDKSALFGKNSKFFRLLKEKDYDF